MNKEEKRLLKRLEQVEILDDVISIYEKLQQIAPRQIAYWEDYIEFISENYELFEEEKKSSLLTKAIMACDKAIEIFDKGVDKSYFYVSKFNLITSLFDIDSFEAQKTYTNEIIEDTVNKAVETDITNPEAYEARAIFYTENEQLQLAEEDYKKALELESEPVNILLSLRRAENAELNKDFDTAIFEYERILEQGEIDALMKKNIYEAIIRISEFKEDEIKIKYYKKLLNKI